MAELLWGSNIDHIATLRNARGKAWPDPVQAAFIDEQAVQYRRHITDRDVRLLRQTIQTRMHLERAVTEVKEEMTCYFSLHFCCLVPRQREKITTDADATDDSANNVTPVRELNIVQAIISRAVIAGLALAVDNMIHLMYETRS